MLKGLLSRYQISAQFFFFLGIFWLFGAFFQQIGVYLSLPILGTNDYSIAVEVLTRPTEADLADAGTLFAIKLVNIMYGLGMLAAGLFFLHLIYGTPLSDLGRMRPRLLPVALTVLALYAIQPIITATATWNEGLYPPGEFLDYAREWSQAYEALSVAMVRPGSLTDNLTTLFMLGLLAPLWEELIYRGIMQRALYAWTRNAHAAIWIAAIIFSVFHLDLLHFVPRVLLGALLGYLYYWSGKIWVPILGHMINNISFVLLAYATSANPTEFDLPIPALVAVPILAAILFVYRRYASAPMPEPPPRPVILPPQNGDQSGEAE